MARSPVNVEKEQNWGVIRYNTLKHRFSYTEKEPQSGEPYANQPVVLNIVITRRCNMDCKYCVAKGFADSKNEDFVLSSEVIHWLNHSPFLLLVLTGGEPLMPPYDAISMQLIESVKKLGIILDTNGTFLPDRKTLSRLRKHKVMIRVSMDSILATEEIKYRQMLKRQDSNNTSVYHIKRKNIKKFLSAGIFTAIQTVVWQKNLDDFNQMIDWMSDNGIKRWYLQRLIPSYKLKRPPPLKSLRTEDYYPFAKRLASKARSAGIVCVPKMDLRHNSVFMMSSDGELYTQGAMPGQKIRLGSIRDEIQYFNYVSAADHACRYYLAESPDKIARVLRQKKDASKH